MKSYSFPGFLVFAFVFIAAGCAPSTPQISTPQIPTPPVDIPSPTPTAAPTAVPLSFTPATYKAEADGFELDYPSGWTLIPISVIGSRGAQGQVLSPGSTPETLSAGGTRVTITIYSWDPKNDLAAFVTQRRTAWDAGGSSIVSESKGDLLDGRKQMSFIVESPEKQQAFVLFTTLGEKYLQIAGEGNLALAEEIAHTMRPVGFKK